ncbi:hypothetical protein, partial [Pseudomonas helleri]|uniref:hypothetical protein n=1 Tax=Pseudomonas helleri TaxID=1608996 RepID=UPI001E51A93B
LHFLRSSTPFPAGQIFSTPLNAKSHISYDSRGRETKIIDYDYRPDGKELLKQNRDLTYNATGALTQIKWGHGTIETFSEDLALRQSTHTTNTGGSTNKVILTTSDQPDGAIKKETMVGGCRS